MISFLSRAEVAAVDWDRIVENSDEGWTFALNGWQELILAVEEWGLQDCSFAVELRGRLVAVVPLGFHPSASCLASSGFGGAGPMVDKSLSARQRHRVLSGVFERVDQIACEKGAERFEFSVSAVTASSTNSRWGVAPYIEHGFDDVSTQTRVADLTSTQEALWSDLAQNARQMVRRARDAGYSVVRVAWPDVVDEYYRVHCETYRRTGVAPHPRAYFAGIAREMAGGGHAVLWAGLDSRGRAVAFHNDARFEAASLYHTGCCESAHLEFGINYLLFWEALCGAREDGCRWYEIGEVFPGVQDGKTRGLTVFKSKFGGELHRYFKLRKCYDRTGTGYNGMTYPPVQVDGEGRGEAVRRLRHHSGHALRAAGAAVLGASGVALARRFVQYVRNSGGGPG